VSSASKVVTSCRTKKTTSKGLSEIWDLRV
jgi:hypothetical protein